MLLQALTSMSTTAEFTSDKPILSTSVATVAQSKYDRMIFSIHPAGFELLEKAGRITVSEKSSCVRAIFGGSVDQENVDFPTIITPGTSYHWYRSKVIPLL